MLLLLVKVIIKETRYKVKGKILKIKHYDEVIRIRNDEKKIVSR